MRQLTWSHYLFPVEKRGWKNIYNPVTGNVLPYFPWVRVGPFNSFKIVILTVFFFFLTQSACIAHLFCTRQNTEETHEAAGPLGSLHTHTHTHTHTRRKGKGVVKFPFNVLFFVVPWLTECSAGSLHQLCTQICLLTHFQKYFHESFESQVTLISGQEIRAFWTTYEPFLN